MRGLQDQLTKGQVTLLTNVASKQHKVAMLCLRVEQAKAGRMPIAVRSPPKACLHSKKTIQEKLIESLAYAM